MEGVLSKWTNVMKGWQLRFFVLDENTGLLSYYTSKEKMRRGVRRGCIRLQGAVIGIDDEEDANFTITVDAKVFHLQAKDAEERELWVRALEEAILKHARVRPGSYLSHHALVATGIGGEPLHRFEQRLAQADVYLQMLIEQVTLLEAKPELGQVVVKANEFLEAVKHSIAHLQIAKNTAFPLTGIATPVVLHYSDPEVQTGIEFGSECREASAAATAIGVPKVKAISAAATSSSSPPPRIIPATPTIAQSPISPSEKTAVFISYSSSDDEQDFYDANEEFESDSVELTTAESRVAASEGSQVDDGPVDGSMQSSVAASPVEDENKSLDSGRRDSADPSIDYDALYDEDQPEQDLGSLDQHGSVLSHLLSQVKIGMDLTKVVLPTFILERRSLLEMYADFFAHPDMFVAIADELSPKERMVSVLRWYLGAFHAGRRSEVAKKPYNPILGEVFQCYWNLPEESKPDGASSTANKENGEVKAVDSELQLYPWVENADALVFFGEQVSHHPPISAFYAEHVRKKITLNAHIWTKSKFLGLSVGVHNVGHATITVHGPTREDYVLGFPNGYARSIFTVPWVELGGPVTISSTQTGYHAKIEFHTKPFFGGDKNKITAEAYGPDDKKKPFLRVEGEWNGTMTGKWSDGRTEKFVDVKRLDILKKRTRPVLQQEAQESRRMWKEVTAGLKFGDIDKATDAKFALEEKQRNEARERREKGETWRPNMFIPAGDTWIFSDPLEQRIKARQKKLLANSSS